MPHRPAKHKGLGALSNPANRFAARRAEDFDDGWDTIEDDVEEPTTTLHVDPARRIISRNQSPDIDFAASINPYKGCSHGCIYCYARPSHEYLDLSAGLDFETQIFHKPDAPQRFADELHAPGYRCTPIMLGSNTDPYQPDERRLRVTRGLLEVASRYNQPLMITTKGGMIARDLDLLADMARRDLVSVLISVTSLSSAIKRSLEPRTASPAMRFKTIARLAEAGVPVGVMVAPVIPAITDDELETILARAADAGAERAGYVLLRLPHGVKQLFRDWLDAHYPDRAAHVMSLVRQMHDGRDYDPTWGTRWTGSGPFAALLARRFELACRRNNLNTQRRAGLNTSRFTRPPRAGDHGVLGF